MLKQIILFVILFCVTFFAQTDKQISRERFNFLVDSLTTEKSSLLIQKEILLSEIDSLQNVLITLEEKSNSTRVKQLVRRYGKKNGRRVASGQVWKGMTEKMLEDGWGKPDRITKNKEKWGVFTQWYYGAITYFFKDGKMTDWEEKK